MTQRLVCEGCGEVHDASEVRARPGPGMPEEVAARMRGTTAPTDDAASA